MLLSLSTGALLPLDPEGKPRPSTLPVPTEAAFTLLLYCELLQWEERPLREFLHYPSQTEWQRKEGLCRKIIHYFNKGKVGGIRQGFEPFIFCCNMWHLNTVGIATAAESGKGVDAHVCALDLGAA